MLAVPEGTQTSVHRQCLFHHGSDIAASIDGEVDLMDHGRYLDNAEASPLSLQSVTGNRSPIMASNCSGDMEMYKKLLKHALSALLFLTGCGQAPSPDATTSSSRSNEALQTDPDETLTAANSDANASSRESLTDSKGRIVVDGITLDVPANWESKSPGSSIITAEFVLPRAEGDDTDGRLTISTAGGTVEANIDRWKGQFDPQPQDASQQEIDATGLKITIVDYSGDFNDQRGPFAPAVKRPGYRMIAAVIPSDGQLHFIKATGPQKTIAANSDAIRQFIQSARTTK
jgi:hypothetical protein